MERTDTQLIQDYISGDAPALDLLISRHIRNLYSYIYRFCGDSEATDDIVQEAFVKAWKNLGKFRTGSRFDVWLFSIARNTAIDYLRRRKNHAISKFENEDGGNIVLDNLADPGPLADEIISRVQNKQILDELIAKLSPAYREVLILRYNDHFTFSEISGVLNRPLNTVKSQHRRALLALKQLITHQNQDQLRI